MSKRTRSAQARLAARLRISILSAAALIVVAVLGYGIFYSIGAEESGDFAEGTHYWLVEDAPRRRPGDPILVTEFFSYGCVHCRRLDPMIEEWRAELPDDVAFERSPVAFNADWALLGQTYLALQQAGALARNHGRIFRAIHDNGRQFLSLDDIADFLGGSGISRQAFLNAFRSPEVRRKLAAEDARQRRLGIVSVPTLAVADKYVLGPNLSRRQILDLADQLIALERGEPSSQPASP